MSNVFNKEQIEKWYTRISNQLDNQSTEVICELKIDGLAISLRYENGIFVQGSTRGDGSIGEDITNNLKTIKSIPLKLLDKNPPEIVELRGEVYFPKSSFKKFNEERSKLNLEEYSNTRNAASGALRQLDPKETSKRPINYFMYSIGYNSNNMPQTQSLVLEKLNSWGLRINPWNHICNSVNDIENAYMKAINDKDNLNYGTDGIVIKINDLYDQSILGTTSRDPRWATAYKFPTTTTTTILNKISVNIGRTGVLTPFAELEPVKLEGVTIRSASLHNIDYIDKKNIRDPIMWGLFGGSVKKNEMPIKALKREINEEINIKVSYLKKFCKIFYKKDMMECYIYLVKINQNRIKLNEGQDYGFFLYKQIASDKIYSKKTKNHHQVTHITLKAIKKYNNV